MPNNLTMPNNLQRSQPDKWFTPLKKLPTAKLAKNETLASILHIEIETIQPSNINHNLFAVIRKGNKAIARFIITHHENGNYCSGHASDIAEYPIENQKDLIEEVRNHGLMVGIAVASKTSPNLKLDPSKPAFYLETPENATNDKILMRFAMDNDPQGETAKQIITTVLGLKETQGAQQTFTEAILTTLAKKENEGIKTNNLAKAAKELELINKYGKKQIQELARKINYQWAGHKYTRNTTIKNKPTQNVK